MKKYYQGIKLLTSLFFLIGWFGSGYVLVSSPLVEALPLLVSRIIYCVIGIPFFLAGLWIVGKFSEIFDEASQTDDIAKELQKWENRYIECANYCVELENKLKNTDATSKNNP